MAPRNNGDVTDEELGRVADHICIDHLDKVCVQYLGLMKNEVASCRYNAKQQSGSDSFAWMAIFDCLINWRDKTKDSNPRELLYKIHSITFLKDTVNSSVPSAYADR